MKLKRLQLFKNNPYLKKLKEKDPSFLFDPNNEEEYDRVILVLKTKCKEIREGYIRRLFLGTAISPNGFIDAIMIISASVNLIKKHLYSITIVCP